MYLLKDFALCVRSLSPAENSRLSFEPQMVFLIYMKHFIDAEPHIFNETLQGYLENNKKKKDKSKIKIDSLK